MPVNLFQEYEFHMVKTNKCQKTIRNIRFNKKSDDIQIIPSLNVANNQHIVKVNNNTQYLGRRY